MNPLFGGLPGFPFGNLRFYSGLFQALQNQVRRDSDGRFDPGWKDEHDLHWALRQSQFAFEELIELRSWEDRRLRLPPGCGLNSAETKQDKRSR